MLKSRIESKSGNNKNWKASPELFDGTIRSFGTDDRPSTELCAMELIRIPLIKLEIAIQNDDS